MLSPCLDCERKGCGSYHDKCEKYQAYKESKYQVFLKKKKEETIREYKGDGRLKAYKKRRNRLRDARA